MLIYCVYNFCDILSVAVCFGVYLLRIQGFNMHVQAFVSALFTLYYLSVSLRHTGCISMSNIYTYSWSLLYLCAY